MQIHGYATTKPGSELSTHSYEDTTNEDEVRIKITHCGICHSDIHLIDNDWHVSQYPFIPGHEIIGVVEEVGSSVEHLQEGQRVGMGWQCSSCHHCEECMSGEQHNCAENQPTCIGRNGGYADNIIVDAQFAIPIPKELNSAQAAPLLCAGITVYNPISTYSQPQDAVAVVGIGGLGHLAVSFANARGCHVTAITTSPEKADELRELGAHEVINAKNPEELKEAAGSYDAIYNTAPVSLDWNAYLALLKPRGTFVQLGAGDDLQIPPKVLIGADKKIVGSHIGSPAKIQEMLRFAARHDIQASIEEYALKDVNEALKRARSGDARYRVVLKTEE